MSVDALDDEERTFAGAERALERLDDAHRILALDDAEAVEHVEERVWRKRQAQPRSCHARLDGRHRYRQRHRRHRYLPGRGDCGADEVAGRPHFVDVRERRPHGLREPFDLQNQYPTVRALKNDGPKSAASAGVWSAFTQRMLTSNTARSGPSSSKRCACRLVVLSVRQSRPRHADGIERRDEQSTGLADAELRAEVADDIGAAAGLGGRREHRRCGESHGRRVW